MNKSTTPIEAGDTGMSLVLSPEDYHSRPDLCALAVLERVSRFMDDEVERIGFGHHERYFAGMKSMRESVNELIKDIIRDPLS